jgi:5'-3' exonuclease
VLEALAIPTLEVRGVEADDVIATLAEQAAGRDRHRDRHRRP